MNKFVGEKPKQVKLTRAFLSVLLVLTMVLSAAMPNGLGAWKAYAAAGDVPAHEKILQANDDGTYTIALTVTGDAEKKPTKANVIVVFDTSSSMNTATGNTEVTYTPTDAVGGTLYGLIDGEYHELTRTNEGSWWSPDYHFWYNGQEYTGQRYSRQEANQSRLQAAEAAVNELAAALLAYNGKDGNPDDTIEMALVDFANHAEIVQMASADYTTDYDTFAAAVNSRDAGNNNRGTNWEAGLSEALGVNFGNDEEPNEKTYVIFVSDGNPTFRDSANGYTQDWNNTYSVYGSGSDNDANNVTRCYNAATDDAKALVDAGYEFYTIGVYGNVSRMESLTTAAGASSDNYYSADDTAALQAALAAILEKIEMAGIGNVDMTDGTTSNVSTSTGTAHLLDVADPDTFKYYRAGGDDGNGGEKYDSDANTLTTTVMEEGEDGELHPVEKTVNIGEEWEDAPEATFVNGAVKWDLGDDVLENGVTYTVTFDCWPSQETLDIVADIKNNPSSYDSLDENIKKYIDEDGNLKTNTDSQLNYVDTRTGQEGHSTFVNPDPVETQAVEMLTVSKEWKNDLEDDWTKPTSIDLYVTRDGSNTYDVSLGNSNDWTDEVYISIGIMRTDGSDIELLTTGHNFTFTEPENYMYKWEIDVPTVRPMLIDNELTLLIKVDKDHPAPEGAKTYTLPTQDGVEGGTYYVGSVDDLSLTATNERRSSINIKKHVDGEDAPDDATFQFTLNVKNSLAPATEPTAQQDPGHDSDWWVWISVWDETSTPVNEGVVQSGATFSGYDGWYIGVSGQNIVLNVKDGYSIRLNNLPEGTEYSVTEGTIPDGFHFGGAEIEIIDGSGTSTSSFTVTGQKASGTVEDTNTLYQVTVNNVYELTDLEITKEWVDQSNQDGIRPSATDFAALLTLSPAVAGKTPTVVDNGDNTYTITYTDLPRYNNGQEIEYTVTEAAIDGYTTTGNPAKDHETITNTHTPEVINIKVEKAWDDEDDQDGIRPDSVTVQLKKGTGDSATNVGNPVTLDEDNDWTHTWTGLDKKEGGSDIVYSVVETPVPTGYTAVVSGDAATGFTVTNTHEPDETQVTVTKVWKDDNNSAETRPESVSVTLYANGTAVGDAVTLSASTTPAWTYTWTGLDVNAGGTAVTYTVTEAPVDNYATSISAISGDAENGYSFTITNSNIPVDASTEAFFKKTVTTGNPTSSATFEFSITADDGTPMPGSTTGTAEYAAKETGDKPISFGKIVFTEAGTYTYTITETSKPDGWTVSPESGAVTVTVVVSGNAADGFTATVTGGQITNNYAAEGSVVLAAKKTLIGRTLAADEFSFELKDADGKVLQTKKNASDGTVTFDTIKYTAAGTYTYTITEVKGTLGGVTYDEHTVTVTVEVVDNGDGTLTATATYAPDNEFKNTYAASGEAPISATKVLTGKELKADMFSFDLKDADGEVVETVKNAADGTITFTNLTFDQSDAGNIYTYTITEQNGGQRIDGITYDDLEITVTVNVEDNGDGTLKVTVTYSSDTEFNNTYTVDPVNITLGASKTLQVLSGDNAPDVSGKYTLTLKDVGGNVVGTAKVNQDGAGTVVYFDEITYTAPGTYIYTVTETGTVAGVTNDAEAETGKTIVVTVVDNGDGTMTATAKVGDAEQNYVNFTNTYSAAPVKVDPPVQKVITGNETLYNKGHFTFTITGECTDPEGVEAPMPEKTTIKNIADDELEGKTGFYEFGWITFTVPGTYEYTVTESGSAPGVTNDQQASKKITFTVTDNGEGQLVVTPTTDEAVFVFTNVYEAAPIEKAIEVDKSLVGKKLTEDDVFTFTLTPGEGAPGEVQTATNDANGHVTFAAITYDTAGTYTYTVTEVQGDDPNITKWDDHTVTATVTITDNWDGTFSASVTYSPDHVFVNEYTPDPTKANISVNKVMTGRELNAGEFSFTLTEILPEDAEEGTEPLVLTAKNDANGLVNFDTIEYTEAGTYTYVITEDEGDLGGVTYDKSEITVTVVVTYNEETGVFSTEVTYDPEEKTFTNPYVPAPVKAAPEAEKILEGRELAEGEFSFQLIDAEGNVVETVVNAADGSIVFSDITFEAVGEYKYTIKEVKGELGGVTYDEGEIEVTITVTDDLKGNLVAKVTYGDKTSFTNTYEAAPTKAVIEASKKLTGRDLAEGEFSFSLVDGDGKLVETVKNTAAGSVVFSAIEYDKAGTYTYTITETIGELGGVTYDTKTVNVTVTVVDDGNGNLVATVSYDGETEFKNTYAAKGSVTPEVTKVLTGRDLKAGEFTFTLTDENGKVVDTQVNAADGKVTFKTLDYTEADAGKTFTYTITEAKGTEANITYDTHTVTFTVKVEDNGDGTLTVTGTYSGDQKFTNKYTKPEEPKTGDTSRPEMWLTMAGGSLAGIIGMLLLGLRRRLARRSK